MYVDIYVYTYIYLYINTYTYIYIHIYIYMYTHIYIGFFCLFILVYDGMCVCICVPQTHLNCHQETCPSACWSIS